MTIIAVFASGALASAAEASTTFCVVPEATCAPAQTYSTLGSALSAASVAGGDHKVQLGAATYTASSTSGFSYSTGGAVEIAGHGSSTVITAPAAATKVLLVNVAGSSVHDVSFHIPASVPEFAGALWIGHGTVANVSVDDDATQTHNYFGIDAVNSSVTGASVTLQRGTDSWSSTGIYIGDTGSPGGLTDSSASATVGVQASSGGAEYRHLRVTGYRTAISAIGGITVSDSLLRIVQPFAGASGFMVQGTHGAVLVRSTVVTAEGEGATGAAVASDSSSADLSLDGVVIHGFGISLSRIGSPLTANLAVARSDFDPAAVHESGPGSITFGSGNGYHADPGFADEAALDYRLRAGSPLIDAGDPAATGTDLAGATRNVDGNGDGQAAADIGAFEFQPGPAQPAPSAPTGGDPAPQPGTQAPGTTTTTVGADTHAPKVTRLRIKGRRVSFAIDESATVDVTVRRGKRRVSHRLLHLTAGRHAMRLRRLKAGRYRVVLRATDAAGNRSGPAARRFRLRP